METARFESDNGHGDGRAASRGFTLIEVLVVVAIIALLIAILLPSLKAARDQARLTVCKANCKQIGTIMVNYQATFRDYVPVVFNYDHRLNVQPGNQEVPERVLLLSLALRHVDPTMRQLPARFDPNLNWRQVSGSDAMRTEYEAKTLPDHWVCPFVREKGSADRTPGQIELDGTILDTQVWTGRHESYHTWRYEGVVVRGLPPVSGTAGSGTTVFPDDSRHGRPKYSAVSWNRVIPGGKEEVRLQVGPPDGAVSIKDAQALELYRKWTVADMRRLHSADLSAATAALCAQGNWVGFPRQLYNPGSHRSGDSGGTNAIFADTHVEWVPATQIGWAK